MRKFAVNNDLYFMFAICIANNLKWDICLVKLFTCSFIFFIFLKYLHNSKTPFYLKQHLNFSIIQIIFICISYWKKNSLVFQSSILYTFLFLFLCLYHHQWFSSNWYSFMNSFTIDKVKKLRKIKTQIEVEFS